MARASAARVMEKAMWINKITSEMKLNKYMKRLYVCPRRAITPRKLLAIDAPRPMRLRI